MRLDDVLTEVKARYRERTKLSKEHFNEAGRFLPSGVTRSVNYYPPYPITATKGKGSLLYDLDNNVYLNFLNNYGSMIHGQSHPAINEQVNSVLNTGSAFGALTSKQTKLAQMICERVPSIEKIRFCNSGTEANMFAIRAARAYTGRNGIIKMEGGYHGLYDSVEYSTKPETSVKESKTHEPVPNTMGISGNVSKDTYIASFNCAKDVERILENNANEIAAIIVEPVMGTAGTILPIKGYLEKLRQLATDYNVILIFDEVLTLRLDRGGAQELYGVKPDLTTVGKIIGGGFPVGAIGGCNEVMSQFNLDNKNKISHSGTFTGNNVTMAAGITTMEMFNESAIEQLEQLGNRLELGMKKAIDTFNIPATPTRAGSMLTLHFTNKDPIDYQATMNDYKDLATLTHMELMNNGIFTAPRGAWYLSTVMTEQDIDETIEVFTNVMERISTISNIGK